MNIPRSTTLRIIAVFKLVKSLMLIVVGISALRLIRGDAAATITHWISVAGINPESRYVDRALGKLASLPSGKFKELGIASFIYSALFLTEGTGLWLGKRWAEWLTVLITGSLVPLEGYEICRHPTAGKVLMLIINLLIVAYLLLQMRHSEELPQELSGR